MEEVIDELRERNEPVPVALELPEEETLVEIQEQILIHLPYALREFLLTVSDVVYGRLEPVTASDPYSHTPATWYHCAMTHLCITPWMKTVKSLLGMRTDKRCSMKRGKVSGIGCAMYGSKAKPKHQHSCSLTLSPSPHSP